MMRTKTRRERYSSKEESAIKLPLSILTVNFDIDDNLAFTIRTAACFGVSSIYVIGSVPDRKYIHAKSGSLSDYYKIKTFKNPSEFLSYSRRIKMKLISAELSDNSQSLYEYNFDFKAHTCIVLGHERIGVPTEILFNSDNLFIPMMGVGYCLNTSQTGTAFVSEYSRQYLEFHRGISDEV